MTIDEAVETVQAYAGGNTPEQEYLREALRVLLAERESTRRLEEALHDEQRRDRDVLRQRAEAAEARLREVEAERDHERHEKETVADASQAMVKFLRAEVRALRKALVRLTGDVDDVLRGWQAHKKLAEGGGGMGHNILTEQAGMYGSLSCWLRVERAVEAARAALASAPEPVCKCGHGKDSHVPDCDLCGSCTRYGAAPEPAEGGRG